MGDHSKKGEISLANDDSASEIEAARDQNRFQFYVTFPQA